MSSFSDLIGDFGQWWVSTVCKKSLDFTFNISIADIPQDRKIFSYFRKSEQWLEIILENDMNLFNTLISWLLLIGNL